jgi:hypothetical protein
MAASDSGERYRTGRVVDFTAELPTDARVDRRSAPHTAGTPMAAQASRLMTAEWAAYPRANHPLIATAAMPPRRRGDRECQRRRQHCHPREAACGPRPVASGAGRRASSSALAVRTGGSGTALAPAGRADDSALTPDDRTSPVRVAARDTAAAWRRAATVTQATPPGRARAPRHPGRRGHATEDHGVAPPTRCKAFKDARAHPPRRAVHAGLQRVCDRARVEACGLDST